MNQFNEPWRTCTLRAYLQHPRDTAWWSQVNQRWELIVDHWGKAITHWMPLPEPPANSVPMNSSKQN